MARLVRCLVPCWLDSSWGCLQSTVATWQQIEVWEHTGHHGKVATHCARRGSWVCWGVPGWGGVGGIVLVRLARQCVNLARRVVLDR